MLILYNELNLLHKLSSKYHPQRPERITETIKYLNQTNFCPSIRSYKQMMKEQAQISQNQLIKVAEQQIIKLHQRRYYEFIEGMWCEGLSKPEMFINVDTYYVKDTFAAAFQAVKTAILAVELTLSKKQLHSNTVCLIRPPGHHSGMKNQPHGFSFFNNVAIAANHFVQKTKKKTVILDWDIHHGEGTQKIFYTRNDVLYISLHRYDNGTFFPHIKESGNSYIGQKEGRGFNINISWNFPKKQKTELRQETQTVRDAEYFYCFEKIIIPILNQYEFEAIFISCGFDCADGDPIGDSKITKKGFRKMTKMLTQFKKPIIVVLQGGYNLQALKWGTEGVLQGLTKYTQNSQEPKVSFQELNQFAKNDISSCLKEIKQYWKI